VIGLSQLTNPKIFTLPRTIFMNRKYQKDRKQELKKSSATNYQQ